MIKLFRIDERLIHGQIAIKWSKHLSISHIVVANDNAAKNKLIANSLRMAAPSGIKTAIKSIEDAVELLEDPRMEGLRVLLLVDSPEDAYEIVKRYPGIKEINVGNYGRVAKEKKGMPRKMFTSNIYCDDIEEAAFRSLIDTGINIYYQTIPEDNQVNLNQIFKKGGN